MNANAPYNTFLFNGLGTTSLNAKCARIYNRSFIVVQFLAVVICFIAAESTLNAFGIGLFFKLYCVDFVNFIFMIICIYLLAYMFIFYKAGQEPIIQDKLLFVCECAYQQKWYQRILFLYGAVVSFLFCVSLILFAYFSQNISILALPLYCFIMSKPYLLRKILVYKDKLVLQYRFYGNICIDMQNIGIASGLGIGHNIFAGLFYVIKHKDFILCYHLVGLNLVGLTHKKLLIETINEQSGFDMIHHTRMSLLGLKRKRV